MSLQSGNRVSRMSGQALYAIMSSMLSKEKPSSSTPEEIGTFASICFEDAGDSDDGVVREGLGCGL